MGKTFNHQKTKDFDQDDIKYEKRKHRKNASSGGSKRLKTLNKSAEYDNVEFEYSAYTKYVNTK
jgi:hypothetical protein